MTTATLSHRQAEPTWVMHLALLAAVMCLPLGIRASGWVPGANRLVLPALWALLAGILMARSSLPAWVVWVIGIAVGLTYSVQYATGILPEPGVLLNDLSGAANWLWSLINMREMPSAAPFALTAAHAAERIQAAMADVQSWMTALRMGTVSEDVTVLWFIVSLALWIITFHAAFELLRTQRAIVALLPIGIAVVSNSAITFQGLGFVQVYVAAMLLVMAYTNMARMHLMWERFGLDFSTELRRDSLVAGTVIATVALLLALATPYVTYNRAVYAFWDRFGNSLEAFYDDLDRAFAGRSPVTDAPTTGGRGIALGLLPHDVGLGTLISDQTVMMVSISDAPPPMPDVLEGLAAAESLDPRLFVAQRYWRQRTYDVYNGSGWDSSLRNTLEVPEDTPWVDTLYPHTVLTQTFTLLNVRSDLVFAVNQPVSVDGDYRVIHRGDDDFVALSTSAAEYTVVSHVSDPEEDDLRAAEAPYDTVTEERHLGLPEIPQRVQDLAHQIVAESEAVTRYDKARAIEAYLRRYTYDLDIAPPPLDQDIVDYFLFDVQRGYCDYSASAMVVMLRSVGVASRYASGYGMGNYDYVQERWVVTGRNAHAWAEVYFPGWGWIEFEPTPTELPRQFTGSSQTYDLPSAPPLTAPVANTRFGIPSRWIAFGALAVLLAGALYIVLSGRLPYRSGKTTDARETVQRIYAGLAQRAAWLRIYPEDGQTPGEYLALVGATLAERDSAGGTVADDVAVIGRAYERARYSVGPISRQERDGVVGAWDRLRPQLMRMLLRGAPRSRARA